MTAYLCTFKPKKSAENNGATILVTAVESVNATRAQSRADVLLEDSYPDAVDNFFKVIVDEVPDGVEPPELNTFDNTFHERYDFTDNIWQPRSVQETSVQEQELPEKTFLTNLSLDKKIVGAYLYGAIALKLDNEQVREINDIINNPEDNPEIDTIIRALMGVEALKHAYPELIINLLDAINIEYSDCDKLPAFNIIRDFAENWVSTPHSQRAEKFESKPETNDIEARKYSDIDMDIALAVINANIENPDVLTVNRARNIIKENSDEQFKRISMSLRTIEGIKTCSRKQIYSLTRELIDNGLYSNQLEMSSFIANWSLNNITKKPDSVEVVNLGGGRFSVSGLIEDKHEKTLSVAYARDLENHMVMGNEDYLNNTNDPCDDEITQEVTVNIESNGANDEEITEALKDALNDYVNNGNEDFSDTSNQDEEVKVSKNGDFAHRAAVIEREISEKTGNELSNLCLWRKVQSTDPRYTKPLEGAGFSGTSINSEYMFMRATEMFGPIGIGWGFNILDDKLIDGAPITEPVSENGKIVRFTLVRDADGSLILEKNHSIKIRFWYMLDDEVKGEVESYGATPYLYRTGRGKYIADAEVMKKSLTDAIKKALSMLGFSADIYLGWYDTPEYIEDNKTEHAIKNASDKAEDAARLRQELDDKLTRVADTIKTSVTVNEVTKVHGILARELETHRKSAHNKGDKEYEKYLSSRLRRLSQLKDERLSILSKEEEESA